MMKKLILAAFFSLFSTVSHAACTAGTLPFVLQNNTVADATQVMADFNQIVNSVAANCAGSGANSDITALLGLTTPLPYTTGGSSVYIGGTTGGSTNAQTVASPTPIGFSLVAGKRIVAIASATNTGAMTLDINSTGATAVQKLGPAGLLVLTGGEVVVGEPFEVWYDGTEYVLLNNALTTFGPLTTLASATSTDLGTIPSHNISITGTTTITAFGSTAVTAYPVYFIKFTGTLTLTYNATSLITPGAANIITATNDTAIVEYLGSGNWQVRSYQRANGTAVVNPTPLCGASGLTVTNNSGTPNTNADITAASAVLINPTGNVPFYTTGYSGTVTLNTTTGNVTSTANGMDGEARPTSGLVYTYLISDGSTSATLGSTSATTPTMPTSYIYRCRVGAMITDGSTNFYRTKQLGRDGQYVVGTSPAAPPVLAFGSAGSYSATSPTLATASVVGLIPATATKITLLVTSTFKNNTTSSVLVAPNTAWGTTNTGPTGSVGFAWPVWLNGAGSFSQNVTMLLEGTTVAWASSQAGGAMEILGWTDSVNAN